MWGGEVGGISNFGFGIADCGIARRWWSCKGLGACGRELARQIGLMGHMGLMGPICCGGGWRGCRGVRGWVVRAGCLRG